MKVGDVDPLSAFSMLNWLPPFSSTRVKSKITTLLSQMFLTKLKVSSTLCCNVCVCQ